MFSLYFHTFNFLSSVSVSITSWNGFWGPLDLFLEAFSHALPGCPLLTRTLGHVVFPGLHGPWLPLPLPLRVLLLCTSLLLCPQHGCHHVSSLHSLSHGYLTQFQDISQLSDDRPKSPHYAFPQAPLSHWPAGPSIWMFYWYFKLRGLKNNYLSITKPASHLMILTLLLVSLSSWSSRIKRLS